MVRKAFILALMGCFSAAIAKDLGVFGEVFPIQEKSLIQVIQDKLQQLQDAGTLASYQTMIQERVKTRLENPQEVAGITTTVIPRTFTFDPSLTLSEDLKDHQGTIIHKAGTRINPLTIKPLTKSLLYVDGSQSAQLAWAERQIKIDPKTKVILVKGSPFKLMESMNRPIYFDQAGVSVKKFGITQVPARVIQKGEVLEISEELAHEN
jgi:conjugal transfer pilus assembly protein TraW